MFGAKRLSLNRDYGCRMTPNIGLVLGSQFSVLSQPSLSLRTENGELRTDLGGADRDRTGGLLVANQALSQLSYSPF